MQFTDKKTEYPGPTEGLWALGRDPKKAMESSTRLLPEHTWVRKLTETTYAGAL